MARNNIVIDAILTFISALILLSLVTYIANFIQSEHAQASISQGEMITAGEVTCTVGYIDKEQRLIYTANHCGYGTNDVFNAKGEKIGQLQSTYVDGTTPPSKDTAIIKLDDHVTPGDNTYSGDKKISADELKPEDGICSYSRKQEKIRCGEIIDVDNNVIIATRDAGGEQGDSGGPAWVVDSLGTPTGFVGTYLGFWEDTGVGFVDPFTDAGEDKDTIEITDLDGNPVVLGLPERETTTQEWLVNKNQQLQYNLMDELGIVVPGNQ